MGSQITQPQLAASNYVLDYQCNLIKPPQQQLFQRLGPFASVFPEDGKGQIRNAMQKCIATTNPDLVRQFQNLQLMQYIALFCLLASFVLIFVISFADTMSVGFWIFIAVIAMICVMICVGKKMETIAEHWRGQVLAALQQKLAEWKSMYPRFTFTLIYPVEVWRRGRRNGGHGHHGRARHGRHGRRRQPRRVAIWVYMRITEGMCQTGINEPVFASSGVQQQLPPTTTTTTTTIVMQQPVSQPQPIQMQPQMQPQAQQVFIQGANGQMVSARPAIVNGQQAYVVDPIQQQQPQQMPQQMQQPQQQPQRPPPSYIQQQQQPPQQPAQQQQYIGQPSAPMQPMMQGQQYPQLQPQPQQQQQQPPQQFPAQAQTSEGNITIQ